MLFKLSILKPKEAAVTRGEDASLPPHRCLSVPLCRRMNTASDTKYIRESRFPPRGRLIVLGAIFAG